MDVTEKRISHAEREITSLKFKIKDLQSQAWTNPGSKQNLKENIKLAQNALKESRITLASLISKAYNL